jgi:hypothetical protein
VRSLWFKRDPALSKLQRTIGMIMLLHYPKRAQSIFRVSRFVPLLYLFFLYRILNDPNTDQSRGRAKCHEWGPSLINMIFRAVQSVITRAVM